MKSRGRWMVVVLLGAACCLASAACTSTNDRASAAGSSAQPVASDFQLRDDMRRLWEDHASWTRVYLIEFIGELPNTSSAAARLLQNQIDIGNAIKPFYGKEAGDKLASLLHDHVTGAVAVVAAAKAADAPKFATAKAAWYANADQIAAFLASTNPGESGAALTTMMHTHLDHTLAEATARLTGDWAADVAAYDAVVAHVLVMADTLSAAITRQFPAKVSVSAMSAKDQDLHRAMRQLWEDHVTWTRVFLIDAIGGLPATSQSTARLLQNQVDLGAAIKPFYGNAAGDQLAVLLHDHITSAAAVVSAAKAGDAGALAVAKTAWYANGEQIATLLAGVNPNWVKGDLQAHMRAHLDETFAEATARLTADWSTDVTDYDMVVKHILLLSDVLSDGISKQFSAP